MKIFQVNKKIKIVCQSASTRSGFKHTATIFVNGVEGITAKVNYQNRTWEEYEYQTVLNRLADSASLSDKDRKIVKAYIKNYNGRDDSMMRTTAMVAKMGEIFGTTQKEKNDWKARMIKAGLGNSGLEMPEDWDTLSEEEKERRLNNVIEQIRR